MTRGDDGTSACPEPGVVRALRRALSAWYRDNARDLPWRRTRDPYAVWVSEIMLQQTRVEQGLPYFERFLRAFPTVQRLAAAHEDEVFKAWEGLGYYGRARNLHRAARMVVEQSGGCFPTTAADWRRLPGVGRYTAGAVASIAFGERVPVLDGNVKRALARLFDIAECVDTPAVEARLWDLAGALVPKRNPGDLNQALMELGATVCLPRSPRCDTCPVRGQCGALRRGVQEALPVRRRAAAVPHHDVVVAVIRRRGRYLIGRRPPEGLLGGLWEFPGGKVRAGETHAEALERELREELGVGISVGEPIAAVRHAYTHLRVTLHVYACAITDGEPVAGTHTALRWARRGDFARYAFPKANHKFLGLL